jgi:hypothetical protein
MVVNIFLKKMLHSHLFVALLFQMLQNIFTFFLHIFSKGVAMISCNNIFLAA